MLILLKRDVERVKNDFLNEYEIFLKEREHVTYSAAMHLLAQFHLLHDLFILTGKEYRDIKNAIDEILETDGMEDDDR